MPATNAVLKFDPLVPEYEAAERLGLAVRTLRRWRWAKRGLAYHHLKGSVRYRLSDIEALIAAGRVEPDAAA
jgi:hypothetical protein